MRKTVLMVFIAMAISFSGNSQESEPDHQYYRVLAFTFKYGRADEATQRGMDLFHEARTKIGLSNMVFRSESGPYDLLVFDPVEKNSPFHDDHWENHYKAMIEIMGSEDVLIKELESWSDLVERQETFYYRHINKY